MIKTTLKIDGMACGMCASHINDAVRRCISPKKVVSSARTGETQIITDSPPDENLLRREIETLGYKVLAVESESCQNKGGIFGFLKK